MSSARIEKLKALLRRVEERRAQPRLHAVTLREVSNTVPDLPRVEAPAVRAPSPAALLESIEPPTMPPEPARKAPSSSPLESAMAQFDDSGPLQLEPAPAAAAKAPVPAPDEAPIELTQPKRPPAEREREPTIEFETAKVRVQARELRAVGEPMAAPVMPAPAMPAPAPVPAAAAAPLTAPTHSFEPAPPAAGAQPARSVSAARVEAPKTFGELLQQSLSLRPRA